MTRTRRRWIVVVAGVLVAAGPAVAHEEHAVHGPPGLVGLLPPIAFLLSTLVVSIAVYLDHRGAVDERWADAGVVAGGLGVLASIVLLV